MANFGVVPLFLAFFLRARPLRALLTFRAKRVFPVRDAIKLLRKFLTTILVQALRVNNGLSLADTLLMKKTFLTTWSLPISVLLFTFNGFSADDLPLLRLHQGQNYPLEGIVAKNPSVTPTDIVLLHNLPEGLSLEAKKPGQCVFKAELGDKTVSFPIVVLPVESALEAGDLMSSGATTSAPQNFSQITNKLKNIKICVIVFLEGRLFIINL